MNILILGATGKIGRLLTTELLEHTTYNLILYARNATTRLDLKIADRLKIIDSDFKNQQAQIKAMNKVDCLHQRYGDDRFIHKSLGVGEPDLDWDKPPFYQQVGLKKN